MRGTAARQITTIASALERTARKAQRRGKRKDWHRLRTTSRQLRGALTAFSGSFDRSAQPRLARQAKRLTKLAAPVRDLDVALTNLARLADGARAAEEREAACDMAKYLSRQRDRRDCELRRKLRHEHPVEALARKVRKAVRRGEPPGASASPARAALDPCAREVLARRGDLGGWEDGEALHELRVALKKYRGALTAWSETQAPAPDREARLERLKELLDVLGEHHDWSELARRLERRLQALTEAGASPRPLTGYRKLRVRARREQRRRHRDYLIRFHERLPALVSSQADRPGTNEGPPTRSPPTAPGLAGV